MKRIIYLVLSTILLIAVSLSAFGCDGPSGYEIYNKALENTNALTDFDGSGKILAFVTGQDSTIMITSSSHTKMNKIENNFKMSSSVLMTALNQSIQTNIFYTNGVAYYDYQSLNMKVKDSVPKEEVISEDFLSFDMNSIITDKIIKENWTYTYTVTITGDVVKDKLIKYAKSTNKELKDTDLEIKFSDVKITATIKDNYITYQRMEFSMSGKSDSSGDIAVKYDVSITLNNPGEPVSIDLPGDLDSYTDIDELENA